MSDKRASFLRRRLIAASNCRWAVLCEVPTNFPISSNVNRPHKWAITISRSTSGSSASDFGGDLRRRTLLPRTLEPNFCCRFFMPLPASIARAWLIARRRTAANSQAAGLAGNLPQPARSIKACCTTSSGTRHHCRAYSFNAAHGDPAVPPTVGQ